MSTVLDVLRFVVLEHRDLYPQQTDQGIVYPDDNPSAPLHAVHRSDQIRLWRSTRGLMDQLCKETHSKDEAALAGHFKHPLSKRAELQWTMVQDHARMVRESGQGAT